MKKKRSIKLLAIASAILFAAIMILPLFGSLRVKAVETPFTYVPLEIANIPFDKILDIPADTVIPDSGFGFAFGIEPIDDEIPAAEGYFAVLPGPTYTDPDSGVTYPKIDDVIFTSADSRDDSTAAEATYNSSITKTTTIDFSDVEFTEPGVYRYVITEGPASTATGTYANTGVGYDTYNQRVLDVYIIDNPEDPGNLIFNSAMLLKQNASSQIGAPSTSANWDEDLKSTEFVNKYPTDTLTLKKLVTGNQGSRDQYFAFTIKLESTTEGTVDDAVVVGVSGQDKEPAANAATEYTAAVMEAANNITSLTGAQLKEGYILYLQDGDEVTFTGLVENCSFTITEANKDYTVSTKLEQAEEEDVTGSEPSVTGTMDKDAIVTFTNNKQGTIPTGVILSVAPWVIAGIVIIAGVVFFAIRSRKKYEE
ncbi:MAG: QVPTGV class sortase B protein-sorting domain-containing protein [Lachnospiraceae bacterium]|nr:QVPTGV class sortase B protein-sorting domain-containing protein [Lachnospiraceae bacterium]